VPPSSRDEHCRDGVEELLSERSLTSRRSTTREICHSNRLRLHFCPEGRRPRHQVSIRCSSNAHGGAARGGEPVRLSSRATPAVAGMLTPARQTSHAGRQKRVTHRASEAGGRGKREKKGRHRRSVPPTSVPHSNVCPWVSTKLSHRGTRRASRRGRARYAICWSGSPGRDSRRPRRK
jgi:hypothetical protein